jgi:N utilization substance protein B
MSNARSLSRSAARLAAVQALYQHRLGREIEDEQYADADVDFFDDVVSGAIARRDEIDTLLTERLAQGWTVARLDKTMLQILRAGAYELLARPDIPVGTAISEYVDVAHAFFDEREAKFVNGVLDAVAKAVRK